MPQLGPETPLRRKIRPNRPIKTGSIHKNSLRLHYRIVAIRRYHTFCKSLAIHPIARRLTPLPGDRRLMIADCPIRETARA